MVISAYIFITRIVFCSTNVLSVAALNATTSISARHNILSARTSASYTVTFEAVATDELQECLWCRLLVHPVNGYVIGNHIPAMTMWTVHSFCRTVCTELCPCLRRGFRTVSIQTEHIRSSSWPNELPTIIMAARMFGPDSTGKWNACILPFPTNALVLSHPVNACIPGSALHTYPPSDCPMAVMSRYLLRCFVSILNSILALML